MGLFGGGEDAVETVVILHDHGVVFMIVTTGAGDGDAEEAAGDGVDLIVDAIVGIVIEESAEGEESEGGEAPGGRGGFGEVGGDLVADESVEGEVFVEGADDVIAVGIGVGAEGVLAIDKDEVLGVGVTGDIEPMAAPAFAVPGIGEESVHPTGDRGGRRVADKGVHLGWGWWHSDQVVEESSNQRARIGGWGEGEIGGLEFGEEEGVDGGLDSVSILDVGQGGVGDGLVGPMGLSFGEGLAGTGVGKGGEAGEEDGGQE